MSFGLWVNERCSGGLLKGEESSTKTIDGGSSSENASRKTGVLNKISRVRATS